MVFAQLPPEVIVKVCQYLGNPRDLLNCERTCEAWRNGVQNDFAWTTCPNVYTTRFSSRDEALMRYLRDEVEACENAYDDEGSSPILTVLGFAGWKALIDQVTIELFCPSGRHRMRLRGDTSAALMAVVESSTVNQLEAANALLATDSSEHQEEPPMLMTRHYNQQNHIREILAGALLTHLNGGRESLNGIHWDTTQGSVVGDEEGRLDFEDFCLAARGMLDQRTRDKIVRRLAHQAGVYKLEAGVCDLVWASLVHLIFVLLREPFEKLYLVSDTGQHGNVNQLRQLLQGESMRDVPPFSKTSRTSNVEVVVHTPVPAQIEEEACKASICKTVYAAWHCSFGTEEQERAMAEADYLDPVVEEAHFFVDPDEQLWAAGDELEDEDPGWTEEDNVGEVAFESGDEEVESSGEEVESGDEAE